MTNLVGFDGDVATEPPSLTSMRPRKVPARLDPNASSFSEFHIHLLRSLRNTVP